MVVKSNKYMPNARECALLLLRLFEAREELRKQKMTRARLAEVTLKHLWNRPRLTEQFMSEVEGWLLTAGWALVDAGSTYGAVKIEAVENWPRVSSTLVREEIDEVITGKYRFDDLEHFLTIEKPSARSKGDGDDW
jgi:hypothetical protein